MLALITATRNSIRTIDSALESASSVRQKVKHYLIDGTSTDGTREYLESFVAATDNSVLISQTGTGLYAALNQAIDVALADPTITHIGFLHSDDRLIPEHFSRYVAHINANQHKFFYSDIEYHDSTNRSVRTWTAGTFSMLKLKTGWMPPHTSVVVTARIYRAFGKYNPSFGTAADYEWIVRVLTSDSVSVSYFPHRTLTMLAGGASGASLTARFVANAMDGKAWEHRSRARSLVIRVFKPLRKVLQFKVIPKTADPKRSSTGVTS